MNDVDLMRLAYRYAAVHSTDPSTQNGCLLVGPHTLSIYGFGANRFPDGVQGTESRWERPTKYHYVEHAERDAIYRLAARGISTDGLHMYCYWSACTDCARAIIQAGITRLVTHKPMMDATPSRWKNTIAIAFDMLEEAGVELDQVTEPIEDVQILFNGELWTPK